jgi:hypothetical protein
VAGASDGRTVALHVATRTSCGEAIICQGSAGHHRIDVVAS